METAISALQIKQLKSPNTFSVVPVV